MVEKDLIKINFYDKKINLSNQHSVSGSGVERIYKYKSFLGKKKLVFYTSKNVYDIIQSYKDDNNIYKILNRTLQGDYTALDRNQGNNFDVTKIPDNINDLNDYMFNIESEFNKSDPKLKAYFDNSFGNLVHCIQNNTFETKYKDYLFNNHPEFLKKREISKKAFTDSVKSIIKEVNSNEKVDK